MQVKAGCKVSIRIFEIGSLQGRGRLRGLGWFKEAVITVFPGALVLAGGGRGARSYLADGEGAVEIRVGADVAAGGGWDVEVLRSERLATADTGATLELLNAIAVPLTAAGSGSRRKESACDFALDGMGAGQRVAWAEASKAATALRDLGVVVDVSSLMSRSTSGRWRAR